METLVYIFLYILSIYFAYRVGWTAREVHAKHVVNELATQLGEKIEESIEKNIIRVKIEKHNNSFFVYNMEDDSFMAQGSDRKELEKNLADRYPGKKFAAKEDNLVEMGFLHNESF